MSDFGKRGGTGPNAGRKAETIQSACGEYKARVFKGQRWLVIQRDDEASPLHIYPQRSEQKCQEFVDALSQEHSKNPDRSVVHFYLPASPV